MRIGSWVVFSVQARNRVGPVRFGYGLGVERLAIPVSAPEVP